MKLKPCPFCRREARVHLVDVTGCYDRTIRYNYQPGCETDGCPGEYGGCSYDNKLATIESWNTRATDPLLKEMAEALEKAIRSVSELIGYSRGVDGLHLNGNVATWESLRTGGVFEEWLLEFDEAQEVLQKYHEQENNK